jgi:hemerythrin superfamily protein
MANHAQTIKARATLIMLMLREDHQKIKQLFDQFNETTKENERRDIVTAALAALEVHATLEEELIYPAWREHVGEQDLIDEALKEHHDALFLITALKKMKPDDDRYHGNFTVLGNHVTDHMKEEEEKMFPRVEQVDLDWERLTTHVMQRRQRLEHKPLWLLGVPVIISGRERVFAARAVLSGRSGG